MITIKKNVDCREFLINCTWGGAAILAYDLADIGYLDEFADCMELYLCDTEFTETEVNDLVWFEPEVIAEISDNEGFKAAFNKLFME